MTVALIERAALRDIELLADARASARSGKGRRLREAAQISQAELAILCGVTPTWISLWEAGKRRPTGDAARRYGQALELLERRLGAEVG